MAFGVHPYDVYRSFINGLTTGRELTNRYGTFVVTRARAGSSQQSLRQVSGGAFASENSQFAAFSTIQDSLERIDDVERDLANSIAQQLLNVLHLETQTQYKSLAQLRKAGHPYAKRHGPKGGRKNNWGGEAPPAPLWVVNYQGRDPSNTLSDHFAVKAVHTGGLASPYEIMATNSSTHAAFLAAGTNTALARPYDAMAVDMTRRLVARRISAAAAQIYKLGGDPALATHLGIEFQLDKLVRDYDAGGEWTPTTAAPRSYTIDDRYKGPQPMSAAGLQKKATTDGQAFNPRSPFSGRK